MCRSVRTRIFQLHLHIEQSDDFALALAHVHIAVHAHNIGNLRSNAILLGLDLSQFLIQVLLRPSAHVLVDPMPVVWIVEDHRDAQRIGFGGERFCCPNVST